jgi:uncharacterized protein with HEPN domain
MFNACKKIIKYTENLNFEDFLKNELILDACIRNIEILGEAVKNISPKFKEKYPEIEWKKIAQTRDKLIHFYFGINMETLWKIIKYDIPRLKQKLKDITQKEGWQNET